MKPARPATAFVAIMVVAISTVAAVVLSAAQATTVPVYKPAQRLCVLCDFGVRLEDPSLPQQMGLMADGEDGYIYATSSSGGKNGVFVNQGTIFRFSTATGKVDVLYAFDMLDHGFNPMGGLTRKKEDGTWTFYGTTYQGGRFHFLSNGKDTLGFGVGVLFKFKADPAFTAGGQIVPQLLHVFRNGNMTGMKQTQCKDVPVKHCFFSPQQRLNAAAGYPMSAPVLASDGNFYGVASKGMNYATGILYKVQPSSDGLGITALCVGGGMFPDDAEPTDQQLVDQCMFRGDRGILPVSLTAHPTLPELYGTTTGGAPQAPYGTVFKATLGGVVTVLKNFKDPTEGAYPFGVIIASDRKLYGTTRNGGLIGGGNPSGAGVVYRITPLPTSGFIAASDFEVIRRLNGTTDGAGPVSQLVDVPKIIVDPTTGQKQERPVLYGTASGGGETRGVIFRIDTTVASGPPTYQVAYTFPFAWQAAGSSPQSTLIKWQDSKTGLPVLFGTTRGGGTVNYGTLLRLSGLDLPPVQQPVGSITFVRRTTTAPLSRSFAVPGQTQMMTVLVQPDVDVLNNPQGQDGIRIDASYCRNPHIIQFISRDKFDVLRNQWVVGTYYVRDSPLQQNVSYPFSTGDEEGDRRWRVDALNGPPNPYYDENFGSAHIVTANSITIFDAPSFGGIPAREGVAPNYVEGRPERWRAVFRDFVICNCKAIAEVRWTRQADVKFYPDTQTWKHEAPVYRDISITPASETALDWVNQQLQFDASGQQYPLLP